MPDPQLKLKPCPFCSDGGNPRWLTTGAVYCRDCGANTAPMANDEDSAAVWNMRAPSSPPAPLEGETPATVKCPTCYGQGGYRDEVGDGPGANVVCERCGGGGLLPEVVVLREALERIRSTAEQGAVGLSIGPVESKTYHCTRAGGAKLMGNIAHRAAVALSAQQASGDSGQLALRASAGRDAVRAEAFEEAAMACVHIAASIEKYSAGALARTCAARIRAIARGVTS